MKVKTTVLWGATVAVSFIAGGVLVPNGTTLSNSTDKPIEINRTTFSSQSFDSNTEDKLAVSPDLASTLSLELNKSDDYIPDYLVLYQLLADVVNMNEDELISLLNQLAPAQNKAFQSIFEIFAKKFPQSAVSFVASVNGEQRAIDKLLSYALKRWATESPQEAYQWYLDNLKNAEHDTKRYYVGSAGSAILALLAEQDVMIAVELLIANQHSEGVVRRAIKKMAQQMSSPEIIVFLDSLLLHQDNSLAFTALDHLVSISKEDAMYWYASIQDSNQQKVFRDRIYSTWARQDLMSATDFLYDQSSETEKDKSLFRMMLMFSRSDPELGLQWLNKHKGINQQEGLYGLMYGATRKFPEFVEKHIDSLQDSHQKKRISENLVRKLAKVNHERTMKFINSSPYREQLLALYNGNS